MGKFLKTVPIPMAGVSLGLAALGNLIQDVSEALRLFCGALSLLLLLLVLGKMLFCREATRKDFENPVVAGVSATAYMAMMQLATYLKPLIGGVAFVIWVIAVACHAVLIVYFTVKFLLRFRLEEVFPTYFITYVGIVVASVTSSAFQMEALGRGIFWFGFAAYIGTFAAITTRYCKHAVPDPSKPLFCIYTAPMSLCLTGYLTAMEIKNLPLMLVMEILAQLLLITVLTQLPKLLKLPFYPSYAAFTFPFVITATALKKLLGFFTSSGQAFPAALNYLLIAETILAAVMVGYATVRYLLFLSENLAKTRKENTKQTVGT